MFRKEIDTGIGTGSVVSGLTDDFLVPLVRRTRNKRRSSLDFSKSKLKPHGRAIERKFLLDTFSRCRGEGSSQLVCLHGESGCGKSTLVESLRDILVSEEGALFVSAKCDQDVSTRDPFQAIVAALSDLCDLVSQNETLKESVAAAIPDDDCMYMGKLISGLYMVTGDATNTMDDVKAFATSQESINRFVTAISNVVIALASQGERVVFFVDDIQWIEEESLILLQEVRSRVPHLLLICSYQENDERIDSWIDQQLAEESGGVSNVRISNLEPDYLCEWISEVLDIELFDGVGLSRILYRKTGGNPLYVQQYMESLEGKGLLRHGDEGWDWDSDRIQAETSVTENVAFHVNKRIQQQKDNQIQLVLKLSAFLGFEFYRDTLAAVVTEAFTRRESCTTSYPKSLSQILSSCIRQGFIEEGRRDITLKFTHSSIQESARELVAENMSTQETHLLIGRVLRYELKRLPRKLGDDIKSSMKHDWLMFAAVDHLNQGIPAMSSPTERMELVKLNLKAARRSKEKSSFETASIVLQQAMQLLPGGREKWDSEYDLSLEVYQEMPSVAFITGQFKECRRLADELSLSARTTFDKMPAFLALIDALGAEGRLQDVIELTVNLLELFGETLPSKPSQKRVSNAMVRTKKLLRKLDDRDILDLPEIRETPAKWYTFQVMKRMGLFAQFAGQERLKILCMLRLIDISVEEGRSDLTPVGFSGYAALQLSIGNHGESQRFAKLAKRLLEKQYNREGECQVLTILNAGVLHDQETVASITSFLLRAYEVANEAGFMHLAFTAAANYLLACWHSGTPLIELDAELRSYNDRCSEFYHEEGLQALVSPMCQATSNLLGQSNNTATLEGEIIGRDFMNKVTTVKNAAAVVVAMFYQLFLSFLFDDLDKAHDIALASMEEFHLIKCHFLSYGFSLVSALVFMESHRLSKRPRFLTNPWKRNKTFLESGMKRGNPNCAPYLHLLEAEEASTLGLSNRVDACFRKAISSAQREKLVHVEALCHERAAVGSLRLGRVKYARRSLVKAIEKYELWQATAKVEQLKVKYRGMLRVTVSKTITADELEDLCVSSQS